MSYHVLRQTDVQLSRQQGLLRRDFLRWIPAVGVAAGAVSWPEWVAAQAGQMRRRGKRCILLWMQGGPSQFETFSPLDQHANAGETTAISTAVSGIRIASTLPETAKVMNDICLIRSMTSKEGSHPRAAFLLHTGYLPNPSVRHPSFGSVTAQQLGDAATELPSFVRIGQRGKALPGAGLLGVEFDPLEIGNAAKPPENSSPRTSEDRFRRRLALMQRMNKSYAKQGGRQEAQDHSQLYTKAAKMILSPQMRAFDLSAESPAMRAAYGDTDFGNGCLMARRLIEAGVTFVEVSLGNWDTHQDNFQQSAELCGQLDRPYAQLLRDLRERGLLKDTLVIWMGEFGRTPRINARGGRDHYPLRLQCGVGGSRCTWRTSHRCHGQVRRGSHRSACYGAGSLSDFLPTAGDGPEFRKRRQCRSTHQDRRGRVTGTRSNVVAPGYTLKRMFKISPSWMT